MSAAQVRERGNELYKKGALDKAITAYKEAAALDLSDPLPLSNLSAAYFEAGSYAESVEVAQKALENPQFAADPQSGTVQKILVRSAKSRLHLAQVDEAKDLIDKILPGKELDSLVYALRDASGSGLARTPELREKLLRLPRVRPSIQDVPDYFGPGHDEPESLFTRELDSSCREEPVLSFMLCGVGDARHLFKTIRDYFNTRKNLSQKVHFTILDHKPAVLARVLIFLSMMQEAGDLAADRCEASTTLLSLAYLFCGSLVPPNVVVEFRSVAERLVSKLQNERNPFKWVHIQKAQMKPLGAIIRQWMGLSKTMYPTAQVRRQISLDRKESPPNRDMRGRWTFVPECELEHRFFEDFSVILPPRKILENTQPELADLVSRYQNGCSPDLRKRIRHHLNTYWSINPTLVDFEWEANKEQQGFPDFGPDPFQIIDSLKRAMNMKKTRAESRDAISIVTSFFSQALQVLHRFQHELMIEVVVGDMMEVLERICYHRFQRPSPTSPKKYHVIHMSNIPDYVGGALTGFLYAVPLLNQGNGTGLTSNVLRNPPRWKNIDHFNAEYLLMHDRDLIQKHFAVKLSPLTREGEFNGIFSMTMSDYKIWESVGRRKLALAERLPREKLFRWLYSLFLKLCLPFPRSVPDFTLVYVPLNMTVFMRLLGLVAELGYPSHWISSIVSAVAGGGITTTARAPREDVLTPGAIDRAHDSKTTCVKPWTDEFTTLAAMWRGVWPAGTLVLARDLLPPLSGISEHSVQFPDFTADDLNYPHFALVFWNERKYGEPPRSLRPVLLDDEKGDTTSSARAIRADGVKVLSTFSWVRKTNTATFWLRSDVIDHISADGWFVFIWRIDTWARVTAGMPLDREITRKASFGS
ncbi:hypothetical protein F4860DRAFT_322361 [Xylaria cubensis]|nr:hypothetical protein F4860DRAFT_322361 [Xylaria cubensis]